MMRSIWLVAIVAMVTGCESGRGLPDSGMEPARQVQEGADEVGQRDSGHGGPREGEGADSGADGGGEASRDAEVSEPSAFQFFVIGDTRSRPQRLAVTARSMYSLYPLAVACINVGDITGNGGKRQWRRHLEALATGASDPGGPADDSRVVGQSRFRTDVSTFGDYVRYLGVMGNHDTGNLRWLANWNAFLPGQREMPPVDGVANQNSRKGVYYAFAYQNALFVMLDSEHPSAEQTRWLRAMLRGPTARASQWVFAFFHHPVYPCNRKSPFDEGVPWVQLFEEEGVDIAFVAHSHTYERTCPMRHGRCEERGVVYVNSSAAAVDARAVEPRKRGTASFAGRSDPYDCGEILAKHRGNWNHFCHVAVEDCRLTLQCLSHNASDTGEEPFDKVVLDHCEEAVMVAALCHDDQTL